MNQRQTSFVMMAASFASISIGLSHDASAEEPSAADRAGSAQRAEVEAIEARVVALERRLAEADSARVSAAPGKGFTVTSRDDRYSLNMGSRIQVRSTVAATRDATTQEAQIRTLRLKASGHVLDPHVRFNTQLAFGGNDYEKDSASPIFDAWIESTHLRDLNVRVGQFFVPLDRARTIREHSLHLVDRPEVVREFTLDRDVGVRLSSRDLFGSKVVSYDLFGGTGDGRNRFGGQKVGGLLVGRVGLRPWGMFDDDVEGDLERERRPRLALGAGLGRNWATARQKSTYGATFAAGRVAYTHAAVDVVFKQSGFSFLGEGVLRRGSRDDLRATIAGKTVTEHTRSGTGYFAQAGMMVSAKVEVTARWEQMFARAGTDADLRDTVSARGKQAGGGLNVYLNGHMLKLQTDYFYAFGRDASKAVHTSRVQLDASF